jgi:hypothetical protein
MEAVKADVVFTYSGFGQHMLHCWKPLRELVAGGIEGARVPSEDTAQRLRQGREPPGG